MTLVMSDILYVPDLIVCQYFLLLNKYNINYSSRCPSAQQSLNFVVDIVLHNFEPVFQYSSMGVPSEHPLVQPP